MSEPTLLKERIYFRFFNLDKRLVDYITRIEPEAKKQTSHKGDDHVVSFRLTSHSDLSWIPGFITKNEIQGKDYGIFVSVLTEYDTRMVDVPRQIVELVRNVGGGIVFSFTVV